MWQKVQMVTLIRVRKRVLMAIGIAGAATCAAQFDVGPMAGGYLYVLNASDGSGGSPSVGSGQAFPATASFFYRDRRPTNGNFFAELDWRHRAFIAHLDEGGLGGGTRTDLDVRLDHLYLTFGPEFGRRSMTFRIGLQLGWLLGGSMEGTSHGWSMYPPPQGDWSKHTITGSVQEQFKGDQRLLLAARYQRALNGTLSLSVDPFISSSLSSMLVSGDNVIRGVDLGVRVGISRHFTGRGFWTRMRAGPLRVRMKE